MSAISLDSMTFTVAKIAGTLLGGLMMGLVGLEGAYALTLVLHFMALTLLVQVRIPSSRQLGGRVPVLAGLVQSVRFAIHAPVLLGVLYVTLFMNSLAWPMQQFIPAIGRDYLEVGPVLVGLLAAAEGMGQLASSLMMATMREVKHHGRLFVGGSILALLMGLLFVWSPWYALSLVALAVGGFGQTGFGTMQGTIFLLSSPPEMRGRLLGLLYICIGAGTPVGTLEMGILASSMGTQWSITANLLVSLLLFAPVLLMSPLVWRRLGGPPAETGRGPAA